MTDYSFIPGKEFDAAAPDATLMAMHAALAQRGLHIEAATARQVLTGVWYVTVQDRDCPLLYAHGCGSSETAARLQACGALLARLDSRYFWSHYYLGQRRAGAAGVHGAQVQWFPAQADGAWPPGLLNAALLAFYNPDGDIGAGVLADLATGTVTGTGYAAPADGTGTTASARASVGASHAATAPGGSGRTAAAGATSAPAPLALPALPLRRLRDDALTCFPLNLLANLYVDHGLGAGASVTQARTQALAAIVGHAVRRRVLADGMCLPAVPADVLARTPRWEAAGAALRAAGFTVLVKDASLGGKYPVLNVTLLQAQTGGVLTSFGAHPRFEQALEAAFAGLLRGRIVDALQQLQLPEPVFDQLDVAAVDNLERHYLDGSGVVGWEFLSDTSDFPFVDWQFAGTPEHEYGWLVDAIHAEGKDIYVADSGAPGASTCRIIVPGWSEVYPVADLAWENSSAGIALRQPLIRLHALSVRECAELLGELQTSRWPDERHVWEIVGLAVARGTSWKQLTIGELKTLLALVVGDEEVVLEGCAWLRYDGELPEPRLRVYRCIEALIRLGEAENYRAALAVLYGEATLALAEALRDGEERFFDLPPLGHDFEASPLHQSLLAAHDRLAAAAAPAAP